MSLRLILALAACASMILSPITAQAAAGGSATSAALSAEQEEIAALAETLIDQMAAQCPEGSEDEMLAIIAEATMGKDLEIIIGALQEITESLTLCASARAAVAAANQAAQLAMAARNATGATVPSAPVGAPPNFPFSSAGGSTGGSGGPGYIS